MKNKMNKGLILTIALVMTAAWTQAQNVYKQTAESYITIAGTSTLHDWTMTSKEMTFQATMEKAADGTLSQVSGITLSLPAKSLKSAHSAMDNNAYSALKADKNKTIAFTATAAKVTKNIVEVTGNLAISGVTKPITVNATCQTRPDGTLNCTGSKIIKMTDFSVEPPTFMFGSVKTGDQITISFYLNLTAAKN